GLDQAALRVLRTSHCLCCGVPLRRTDLPFGEPVSHCPAPRQRRPQEHLLPGGEQGGRSDLVQIDAQAFSGPDRLSARVLLLVTCARGSVGWLAQCGCTAMPLCHV